MRSVMRFALCHKTCSRFYLRRPSVNHAPNGSIPSHCHSLRHPILLCHFRFPILTLSPSPSIPMVIQFAIIPTFLPLPILHHPIFLLQHLQCVPMPFHLSRASPSYATEFAFTPLGMAHLEGVVHKCYNLSWGCCFSDIKCLSKKKKKLRVNWRQLY